MDRKIDIHTILKDIESERLIEFLAEYAQTDEKFVRAFLVAFDKPDYNGEISAIKARVADAIRRGTHSGFIDYRGCNYICAEMYEILQQAQRRLEQGFPVIAFGIAMHICLKCNWLASRADSSSGDLGVTGSYAVELIKNACASVETDADKKFIYEKCCKEAKNKVFDGWDEDNYSFLRSCARFVTQRNVKKIFDTLEYLRDKPKSTTHIPTGNDTLVRLEICKYLDGEEEYERQLKKNLDIEKVRRLLVDRVLEKQDYAYAERLCLEYVETVGRGYYRTQGWYDMLFDIYVKTANKPRQEELASQLLFSAHAEKYYDILKSLLIERGAWEGEYHNILRQCAAQLAPTEYMRILKKEGEKRLLLETLPLSPTEIFEYGAFLAEEYPEETYALFSSVISAEAEAATDRRLYGKVCAKLRKLYEAGGREEAFKLMEDFRAKYKRRPSMMDELDKLERKLNK